MMPIRVQHLTRIEQKAPSDKDEAFVNFPIGSSSKNTNFMRAAPSTTKHENRNNYKPYIFARLFYFHSKVHFGTHWTGRFLRCHSRRNRYFRSKLDPEVFLCAAKKLGSDPADCAEVEDAKTGIEAAKAGNMTAFALLGDAKDCGTEDYNLSSFENLLNIL